MVWVTRAYANYSNWLVYIVYIVYTHRNVSRRERLQKIVNINIYITKLWNTKKWLIPVLVL